MRITRNRCTVNTIPGVSCYTRVTSPGQKHWFQATIHFPSPWGHSIMLFPDGVYTHQNCKWTLHPSAKFLNVLLIKTVSLSINISSGYPLHISRNLALSCYILFPDSCWSPDIKLHWLTVYKGQEVDTTMIYMHPRFAPYTRYFLFAFLPMHSCWINCPLQFLTANLIAFFRSRDDIYSDKASVLFNPPACPTVWVYFQYLASFNFIFGCYKNLQYLALFFISLYALLAFFSYYNFIF